MEEKPVIVVIVGPTASGKSALAVRLAKRVGGEVISADSRQVYKGLNIGTGKISKKEMQGVRHHLLDIASPKKVFTAADFVRLGQDAIHEIQTRGKTAIICGGTGFYIDALLGRVALSEIPANKKLRTKLQKLSAMELFLMLQKSDPERAKSMNDSDRQNPVRLIRAIETTAQQSHKSVPRRRLEKKDRVGNAQIQWIGIQPPHEELRKKIRVRLHSRMKAGMVAEVKKLHESGLSWKRMEELGLEYRYLARYLQGKITKDVLLSELETKIWQYAKRQITYWRRNKEIKWN